MVKGPAVKNSKLADSLTHTETPGVYRREDGECMPGCAFQDKPIFDEKHELEISQHVLDDIPVLLITKKAS